MSKTNRVEHGNDALELLRDHPANNYTHSRTRELTGWYIRASAISGVFVFNLIYARFECLWVGVWQQKSYGWIDRLLIMRRNPIFRLYYMYVQNV